MCMCICLFVKEPQKVHREEELKCQFIWAQKNEIHGKIFFHNISTCHELFGVYTCSLMMQKCM